MNDSALRRLGRSPTSGWEVYSLHASGPNELPGQLQLPSEKFVYLLAWNASRATIATMRGVAEKLLGSGCVYFCCWGENCEKVHDVVDDVVVGDGSSDSASANIMTTWHSNEEIAEVTDFFLDTACPADSYLALCSTAVAVVIGTNYELTQVELSIVTKLRLPPSNLPPIRVARKRVSG